MFPATNALVVELAMLIATPTPTAPDPGAVDTVLALAEVGTEFTDEAEIVIDSGAWMVFVPDTNASVLLLKLVIASAAATGTAWIEVEVLGAVSCPPTLAVAPVRLARRTGRVRGRAARARDRGRRRRGVGDRADRDRRPAGQAGRVGGVDIRLGRRADDRDRDCPAPAVAPDASPLVVTLVALTALIASAPVAWT